MLRLPERFDSILRGEIVVLERCKTLILSYISLFHREVINWHYHYIYLNTRIYTLYYDILCV